VVVEVVVVDPLDQDQSLKNNKNEQNYVIHGIRFVPSFNQKQEGFAMSVKNI
jgi:hypothetical protein